MPKSHILDSELEQRRLNRAVRQLIRAYRSSAKQERRRGGRIAFMQPVVVETEDGRTLTLLSSNLSVHGIHLIGPGSLLGQKVRVILPGSEGAKHTCFSVQIVWSSVVSEGLCENGGAFVGVVRSDRAIPRCAPPAQPHNNIAAPVQQAWSHEWLPGGLVGRPHHPRAR